AKSFIHDYNHSIQESKTLQARFNDLSKEIETDNKAKLIAISLKYNILCSYTAFVGVEKRWTGDNSRMQLREVPIEIADDGKNQRKTRMNTVLSGAVRHRKFMPSATSSYCLPGDTLSYCRKEEMKKKQKALIMNCSKPIVIAGTMIRGKNS
ncbi:unnamed protein product, partial [Didymodactylos carnosus]